MWHMDLLSSAAILGERKTQLVDSGKFSTKVLCDTNTLPYPTYHTLPPVCPPTSVFTPPAHPSGHLVKDEFQVPQKKGDIWEHMYSRCMNWGAIFSSSLETSVETPPQSLPISGSGGQGSALHTCIESREGSAYDCKKYSDHANTHPSLKAEILAHGRDLVVTVWYVSCF